MGITLSTSSPPAVAMARFGQTPLQFTQQALAPDVLLYLQSAQLVSAPEEHLCMLGFQREVDYADIPDHTYYEAHYHSIATHSPIMGLHARYGHFTAKPAVCRQLRSFCVALRHTNGAFVTTAVKSLNTVPGAAAEVLCNVLIAGRLFGDVAVQVHFGDGVSLERASFQYDSPSSILCISIMLRGETMVSIVGYSRPGRVLVERRFCQQQTPGSVCLSNAFVLKHSLSFSPCAWGRRVVSIKIRMLMFTGEAKYFQEASQEELAHVMEVLARAARESPIVMPTMDHVRAAETEAKIALEKECTMV